MARKVLFQPRAKRYGNTYYEGIVEVEEQTSENSLIRFHVFRTSGYKYRTGGSGIKSGDAMPKPVRDKMRKFSSEQVGGVMVDIQDFLKDALTKGLRLYDHLNVVLSANQESLEILLEGKTIGNAEPGQEVS